MAELVLVDGEADALVGEAEGGRAVHAKPPGVAAAPAVYAHSMARALRSDERDIERVLGEG